MKNVLVSIGLPTYNRPEKLKRTLDSLIGQSYSNLEIIVSDNCSTDFRVDEIIAEYTVDTRIKYYKQPYNLGAIGNFNFVLQEFTGDFFMRLGNDDWLEKNYIESTLLFLQNNADYVCAYGHPKIFDLDGHFVKFDNPLSVDYDSYVSRMSFYYSHVTQNGPYYGLIRREAIKCVNGEKKIGDDWLGVARLSFLGKIKMLSDTNLNLSQGGVGSSTESIVQSLGLSKFDKCFPYFSIALNAFFDIVFRSEVYKKLGFVKRVRLAKLCLRSLNERFNLTKEIKGSYKMYLSSILNMRAKIS